MTVLMICCTIQAKASNYTDTAFDFYFRSSTGGVSCTERREKLDDTSVYMKCESTSYSYTARVYASPTMYGAYYDVSNDHTYVFNSGTVRKMINYVYENGFKYAVIYADRNYSYNYVATGLWSPDSI